MFSMLVNYELRVYILYLKNNIMERTLRKGLEPVNNILQTY
jgi:hypothetical protein